MLCTWNVAGPIQSQVRTLNNHLSHLLAHGQVHSKLLVVNFACVFAFVPERKARRENETAG